MRDVTDDITALRKRHDEAASAMRAFVAMRQQDPTSATAPAQPPLQSDIDAETRAVIR